MMTTANGTHIATAEEIGRSAVEDWTLTGAPSVVSGFLTELPPTVADKLRFFDRDSERAAFVIGALPVLAAIISSGVRIPVLEGDVSPDLYACVIAPPSSGKGALRWARALGEAVDRERYERSEAERLRFAGLPKDERADEAEPPRLTFYAPADTSAAAFIRSMNENGGRLCLFEEEAATLATALGREWGAFSSVIRKAFHHEPITAERKDSRTRVERPALSILLSGTKDQFVRLFEEAIEDGTFSRYGVYYFEDAAPWRSQRPRLHHAERTERFRQEARRLLSVHEHMARLEQEGRPARFELSPSQWDLHDACYEGVLDFVRAGELPARLEANVKRSGIVATRIACVLSVLRAFDEGRPPDAGERVTCADSDLAFALHLGQIFVHHAIRLYSEIEQVAGKEAVTPKQARMQAALDALPPSFGRVEMNEAARRLGVSQATLYRYAKEWEAAGVVDHPREGRYLKNIDALRN